MVAIYSQTNLVLTLFCILLRGILIVFQEIFVLIQNLLKINP